MGKRTIFKIVTCILTACCIIGEQAFSVCAASSTPDFTDGGSYYQYQWGLKNNGNIKRTTSSSASMEIRRGPGEEIHSPLGSSGSGSTGSGSGSGSNGPGGTGSGGRGGSRIGTGIGIGIGGISIGIGWFGFDQGTFSLNDEGTVVQAVADIDINVEPAWDYYEQSTERRMVTVALIDTGVDITHTDLQSSIWVNSDEIAGDGIDNDGNGYIDDVNGWNFYSGNNQVYVGDEDDHGTHGAGTIAAAWDGAGIVGIADSTYVRIMPLKVFGSEDSVAHMSNVKEAIRYAEANGADICNLSMGTYDYDEELEELMSNSSMLFVVSAGNGDYYGNGYDIDTQSMYPASFAADNIIAVANLMFDGSLSSSSNYGAQGVDIAAPGTYILSTMPGGTYGFMSGTSMSAPMVTGIAALIYSCRTDMTIMDVKTAIMSTARELSDLSGRLVTGGIPDTYAAITYGLN